METSSASSSTPTKTWKLFKDESVLHSPNPVHMSHGLRQRLRANYKRTKKARDYAFLFAKTEEEEEQCRPATKQTKLMKENLSASRNAGVNVPYFKKKEAVNGVPAVPEHVLQSEHSTTNPPKAGAVSTEITSSSTPAEVLGAASPPVKTYKLFKDRPPIRVPDNRYRLPGAHKYIYDIASSLTTNPENNPKPICKAASMISSAQACKSTTTSRTISSAHQKQKAQAVSLKGSATSKKQGLAGCGLSSSTLRAQSHASHSPALTSNYTTSHKRQSQEEEIDPSSITRKKTKTSPKYGSEDKEVVRSSTAGDSFATSNMKASNSAELHDTFDQLMSRTTEARRLRAAELAFKLRNSCTALPALKANL